MFYFLLFLIGIPNGFWSVFVTNAAEQFGTNMRAFRRNLINVLPKPIANFAVSDTLICPKQTVQFTDRSKTIGSIDHYYWKFNEPVVANDFDTVASSIAP